MRRILGLDDGGDGEPQYLDDEISAAERVVSAPPQPEASTAPAAAPAISSAASVEGEAESIAADMLAEVVAIFNAFQPEFIARSLDPVRQEALLTEKMTPALKSRLEAIASKRREQVDTEARAERVSLDADLKRMRDRNAELERRRSEFRDEQLSAKRQKRALTERIADLEAQLTQLAADKEQLELEKRSMANKIRVASIAPAAASAEAQELPAADKEAVAKAEARAAEAEARAAAAEAKGAEMEKNMADMAARGESLSRENEALINSVEALKERCRVADEMIANFRKRLADAERNAMGLKADEERKARIYEAANTELDSLRAQVASLRKELEQSAETADLIARKDARINELKARLRDAAKVEETIDRLQKENRSLRDTIEANLYEHAAQVSSLRRELEALDKPRRGRPRKDRHQSEVPSSDPSASKRKSQKISAIDELIEGCEWMKAPTDDDLKAAPVAQEPAEDFGYRPPARKPQQPDDANQLTLF